MSTLVRDVVFDAEIDSANPVHIEGFRLRVSDALALRPSDYAEARKRWRSRKDDETHETVVATYPHPIAVRFKKARQKLEWSQKLDRLQDTWEAIIIVTAGLCVCEARQKQLVCSSLPIKSRDIAFHVIHDAIELTRALAADHAPKLTMLSSLPADTAVFDQMEQLNTARRHLAHSASPSEAEARALYEECEPVVFSLLESLAPLGEVSLVTPLDTQRGHRFVGASADLEATPLSLSDEHRAVVFGRGGRPDRRDVYAVHERCAFCVSPLFRWEETEDGHFRFLYLDEVKTSGLRFRSFTSTIIYDTSKLDDHRVRSLREDEAVLRGDFEQLRALVRSPKPTQTAAQRSARTSNSLRKAVSSRSR